MASAILTVGCNERESAENIKESAENIKKASTARQDSRMDTIGAQLALQTIRDAAEQGNAKGQYYLGVMYRDGEGVPQDKAEAMKWFRKAAEQGNSDAKEWLEKNSKESEE
jgi:TPR repeat protein